MSMNLNMKQLQMARKQKQYLLNLKKKMVNYQLKLKNLKMVLKEVIDLKNIKKDKTSLLRFKLKKEKKLKI